MNITQESKHSVSSTPPLNYAANKTKVNIGLMAALLALLCSPSLGLAGGFVILSKTGITDVYASAIVGDVGTSPITGAALLLSCDEVAGTIYTVDAAGPACEVIDPVLLTAAVSDMQ